MPLDSLGLGLTLDTALLEKADKTLENMHKNSKLIMQNLTRGFTSFNSGGADAFTKMSTALGHVSDALTKIDNAEVSPDFDTKGQEKFIDRMQKILSMVEKMSKIKDAKFYDPTEVYVTDKDATDIFGEMQALQEHKKKLAELVEITKNYDHIQRELKKTMYTLRGEIPAQKKEVDSLANAYNEAKKKQEAALKAMATQFKAFSTRERKKDSSLTDEQLLGMFASKDSMRKYVEEVTKANEELVKAEEKLVESKEKLEQKQSSLREAGKEYQSNWRVKQQEEEIKLSYENIKEREKILQKELEFSQATEAERAAMLTKKNEAEIKADQKRIRDVQKSYEQLRKEIQKGEKDIADLEKSREKLKAAGGKTKEIDDEIAALKKAQDEKLDAEIEFRTSKYWPQLEEIDKKYSTKAFKEEQKRKAKEAEKASRKDVTAALQYSRNAQTINEEKEAIKRLVEARDNLSTSTARYKKTVEDINKRILAHKDHIEAVTRVEKEQNTLADSVINRYRKQLKALDDVDEALDKIAKKQQSTRQPYNQEEARARIDLVKRRDTIEKDILDIESRAQGELDVIKEQHEAERAKKRIDEIIRQNEREKQEYAKLLDDLYALEKQKKSMEDAGGGVGDVAYDKLLQQEADLQARKAQLESQHQNDLDEIRKKHDKKRNDDEVKAFIDAQKEKQRIAEEYAKKQREKAKKYGTISNASAERLIGVADKAQNVNQHKLAIEKLTQARNSLNTTDKDYLKTVKKLNDAIKYHEIEIELVEDKSKNLMQTHRGLMDIGGQLMRRLALVFSVSQLTQYFRKLVEVRGEFEKTEVALTTILKSRAQANVLMNQITDLAVKSPFTLQQLVGYTKQLAAYQIEYKKLYSTTKMLADVSAGLGVEMDRLILAFGQVRAANFLRATEVRQFTEAGFDILGELAKHYSTLKGEMVSVAEVQEMVTKRMVGFADVEKVFQNVTSAGGIFYDMQAKQAETLAGQWSNLQDKISIMYNEIGKSTDGMLKGIVSFLASLIDNWEGAATVLKGVVTAFAMVKINAALTNKETIKFVRSMGLIKGRVKAVGVIQLLGAAFVKLGRSIKAAGVALKAFVVNNPYVAALLALVGVIGAVVSKHHKQEEAVKGVIERYDQLHESITDINSAMLNAINEQDLDKQKEALKELVDMVDKEYNMTVNIDIENLNHEEIAQKFNEIMDEAEKLNIFGELFGSGLEGFKAKGQNALKDISQYGEAANNLFKQMVDKSNMVASALQEIDAEKYKDIIKDLVAPRDIRGGESELAYLNRLYEAYMKIKEETSIDLSWDEDTNQYIARTSDNFYELGKILGKIDFNSLSLDYANALKEFKDVEFINYLDTLTDSLTGLTDEQKEKKLKFAIDTEAAHREWNAFVVQLMYEIANTKFGLHIKPTIEAPEEVKWKEWQENYKKKFEKEEGYMRITSPSITQEAQIKALNEEYAKQYDLLERIKKAGGQSALEVGGAYEGLGKTMEEIAAEMEDVNAQIEYLGGKNTTTDKNEKASQKILSRRISILKEIHEAYKQARKDDLGHDEAVQKVMKDWGDTFTEAFAGTNINLSSLLVDKEKLAQLKDSAKDAGIVFSEEMEESMQEIFENNTYIRKSTQNIIEALKLEEGWKNKAYQDMSGVWTIGGGSTKQADGKTPIKKGDYWTDEEMWKNSQKQIKEHEDRLNEVLDKHRDILLTQEQYNVLLKATWQGGGTSVIPMAKDAELFKKRLEEIDGMPIVKILMNPDGTIKERKKVGIFDIDIDSVMQEYENLESVYERMALVLKYIGNRAALTKDTTQAMIDRANKRSADFLGDTYINNLLQQASQTIADFDFSTPEGLVKAMRGLMPIAKKEGKEAMLALSKEISKVENEIGVKIRLENVDEFKVDIEKTLGDYRLWKDIEKLQMPYDVASKIFGVTPKTLQQIREEVLKALKLGEDINLGNEEDVLAAVKLQYGEPTKEVVRNFFKNVNQIQRNETEEQAKRFVKFLTQNLDQTKVIMSQRGVDIAFAKEQFDKGTISAKRFAEIVKNIIAQSNEEISKFNLEKFKETPEYIQAMGDLSSYSKKEIQGLIKTLNDAVTQNAHLFDADEVKAYMDALKKAQEEIESRDVFKWGDFERAADIIQTQKEIEDKKVDIADNKATLETQKEKLKELEQELERLKTQKETESNAGKDTKDTEAKIAKKTQEIVEANEGIEQTNSNIKTNTGLLSTLGDKMKGLAGNMGSTFSIIDAIVHGINDTVQGINTIYGEIGSVMESFGKETDFSTGFGKGAMLMDTFAKSSQAAADGWDAFKSRDPVGVVVNVVKSITEIIKGINAYHDAGLEVSIQDHLEEVERLQKEYEKLEWVIGRAFAFDKYGMVAEQTKNIGKQIENTSKAIALEEDKKDTDEERIKELRENAEDARRQIHELYDNLREEIVGSYEDLSSTLADAMIEALKNGEDALKAWGDEVDNIIANIATKLAVQKYVEPQVSNVLDQFYNKVMPKNAAAEKAFTRLQSMTVGTKEYENALAEWEKLNSEAIGELPQLTESSVNALKDSLNAVGVSFEPIAEQIASIFGGQGGGLSALQKGISGMSEQQAEILTAYWNSVRGYTASIDSKMDLILANLNVSAEDNPMLAQLMMVAKNTSAINTLLSSLVKSGHTLGGSGIKVFMS